MRDAKMWEKYAEFGKICGIWQNMSKKICRVYVALQKNVV